jgi:hypothetical protein
MTTPYDHLVESASTLEADDIKALADALLQLVKEKETKCVSFTVRQQATLTCSASVDVPRAVLAQGHDATRKWLWANQDKWENEDVAGTDYGSYLDGSMEIT